MVAITRPTPAVQKTRRALETCLTLATRTLIMPVQKQADRASISPSVRKSCAASPLTNLPNRKGGLQTKQTPANSMSPDITWTEIQGRVSPLVITLIMLSFSRRTRTERRMVTRGAEKMMQRASGTGMRVTLAMERVKLRAPVSPAGFKF